MAFFRRRRQPAPEPGPTPRSLNTIARELDDPEANLPARAHIVVFLQHFRV